MRPTRLRSAVPTKYERLASLCFLNNKGTADERGFILMLSNTPCQLILDPPAEGAWNMAVDEALLDAAAETDMPVLRFYQWLRPTLSLGYFQPYADRKKHPPSLEANVVRRLSGGGAILHDREVTYSLILPHSHRLARDTQQLYRAVHEAFLQLLNRILPLEKSPWQLARCEKPAAVKPSSEPFLCFERRSPGDLLLKPASETDTSADTKIVGSAQRRRRGAVMQHGSLLLGQSALAPELLGLNEIVGSKLDAEEILQSLPAEFSHQLGMDMQKNSSAAWHQAAQKLVNSRYACSRWSMRR